MSFAVIVFILLLCLAIGLPVAFSLFFSSLIGILLTSQSLFIIPHVVYSALDNFVLLAIPLFIFMGHIMLEGGIGETIFDWANVWLRHLPGGLVLASILSCALFAAISGSSVATALTIGIVAFPAMVARGYQKEFVLGALAAGGTLGIIIPPSIPLILYGTITEESVGKLFIAGIIPGIVIVSYLMIYSIVACSKNPRLYTKVPPSSWKERWEKTIVFIPILSLPVIVIGGIYTGIFTPTEASAVGVICSYLTCMKKLGFRDIIDILKRTAKTSIMLLSIVAGAKLFGHVMATMQVAQNLTKFVIQLQVQPWMFIVFVMILLIILGALLDPAGIILITTPIFLPILQTLGIDLIYFGVIFTVNMELANVTPPVGMNLFVLSGIMEGVRYEDVVRGVIPFIIVLALGFVTVVLFPTLSTWLPTYAK